MAVADFLRRCLAFCLLYFSAKGIMTEDTMRKRQEPRHTVRVHSFIKDASENNWRYQRPVRSSAGSPKQTLDLCWARSNRLWQDLASGLLFGWMEAAPV